MSRTGVNIEGGEQKSERWAKKLLVGVEGFNNFQSPMVIGLFATITLHLVSIKRTNVLFSQVFVWNLDASFV